MKHALLWMLVFVAALSADSETRIWMLEGGQKYEAELVRVIGDRAVLKNVSGEIWKVDLKRLSADDRVFIELEYPPQLEISFRKKSKKKKISTRVTTKLLPEIQMYTFGTRVRQKSDGAYPHPLHVELFVIGKERAGNRFILLDRQSASFSLTRKNRRVHEFWGQSVELDEYEIFYIARPRGKKYVGHLIVITDVRGRIVATQASFDWLIENLEKLKKMPEGGYMDKTCTRTFPTRPKPCRY